MGRYGSRSHTLLSELPAVASTTGGPARAVGDPASTTGGPARAVGDPASTTGGPARATRCLPAHHGTTRGTTRRRAEGLLDLVQASVLGHRQAAQAAAASGTGPTPHRRSTRTPQAPARPVPARDGQRRIARPLRGALPQVRTWPAAHHRGATRRPADRGPGGAAADRGALQPSGMVSALPGGALCRVAFDHRTWRLGRTAPDDADRLPQGGLPRLLLDHPQVPPRCGAGDDLAGSTEEDHR